MPEKKPDYNVPEHLRNAPATLMKEMGLSVEYRYAHDKPNAYWWVKTISRKRWRKRVTISQRHAVWKPKLVKSDFVE